jgi:hypothetical protein
MRAQASFGSGADILALKGRGWRGMRKTCRRQRWRMQLGDEVDDDGENGSRRITTPDVRKPPSETSALHSVGG